MERDDVVRLETKTTAARTESARRRLARRPEVPPGLGAIDAAPDSPSHLRRRNAVAPKHLRRARAQYRARDTGRRAIRQIT